MVMLKEEDPCVKAVERKMQKISKLPISPANKKAILEFGNSCFTEGLSARRVLKYLVTMQQLAQMLQIDFPAAKRNDIEKLVNQIERSPYAEWTKHDYKVALKKFYRCLRKYEDGYPPEVKWIRTTMRKNRLKLPEDMLTQEEIKSMVRAAKTNRDKALIASLYESGCRIGELLNIKMKQIHPHPHGFQITVTGKKGPRRLLLIASAPYITAWLNDHPKNENPDSYLWVTCDYRSQRLKYWRVTVILKTAAKRAAVRKAVNPHNFRHSRATHLAKHLTEAQMNEYMGWVQGSDMPSTYVHLSGRDVDQALLKLNNIQTDEISGQEKDFTVRRCVKCDLDNPPSNKFCSRCGMILDEKAAEDMIKRNLERDKADGIMDRLIQDSEFRTMFERKLQEFAGEWNG